MYWYNFIAKKYINFYPLSYSPLIGGKKLFNEYTEEKPDLLTLSQNDISEIYIANSSYSNTYNILKKYNFLEHYKIYYDEYVQLFPKWELVYSINPVDRNFTLYLRFNKIKDFLSYGINTIFWDKKNTIIQLLKHIDIQQYNSYFYIKIKVNHHGKVKISIVMNLAYDSEKFVLDNFIKILRKKLACSITTENVASFKKMQAKNNYSIEFSFIIGNMQLENIYFFDNIHKNL